MPNPHYRSTSYRKIHTKLPSGKSTIHYERRKNNRAVCAICKKPLQGVKTNLLYKYSKTEKRPERMYGGYICYKCLENLIKQTLRGSS
ncbi:50S ribosomal protein L34e [Sulfurisphaera tokodaii]|uniref:Large ribosomal subunit protein eL34 n=2 Tax=Sulfurisphaera tokodaii TaxID=111955 RepID=RL34_SULTO|nr:50S ribosomal protein L34e [Sulfurisphaera tokodaii]Q975K6.1 RecName: Full=Large ribosomal subunit protein eL34; AltName: Full=50S ribosomal protein L34e [Sulfurisphaera tokodaii str. 7]BAB65394.1 50S ribosomal protein L34e [Sulfurisphaera tokodaii str. 7]HII74909.1 50S ribosomal protein L34e [Sulfurisphaera tokodaii]